MSWSSGGGLTTRSLYLPFNGDAINDSGTVVSLGSPPNGLGVIALADAATQGGAQTFAVPYDYMAGTGLLAAVVWVPGSTDGVAHTVRWQFTAKRINTGDVTAAGTTTAFTGASATRTANNIVYDTATNLGIGSTFVAGDIIQVNLRRLGADGADTYVGVVNIVALLITYTSSF